MELKVQSGLQLLGHMSFFTTFYFQSWFNK